METDYWNALDYNRIKENMGTEPSRLGVSTHPLKEPLSELKAKSFMGASRVEIGFSGREKGAIGKGAFSPEMIGKTKRESIRELAKLNEIELTTHATIGVGGFSGLTEKGFSEQEREKALFEIKRTVDFAADTTQGGPIVVHTGEFPRPIYEAEEKFKAYPKEEKERVHYLVDSHTGELIKTVREDETISIPKPKRDEKRNIIYQRNPDGSIKKDEFGNKIPEFELDKYGNMVLEPVKFSEFKNRLPKEHQREAARLFFAEQQRIEKEHAAGQAEEYEVVYKEAAKNIGRIRRVINVYEKLGKIKGLEEIKKLKREIPSAIPFIPPEEVEILPYLKEKLREYEKRMAYGREVAASGRRQEAKIKEMIKRAKPLEEFGVEKSAEAIARSALYAFEVEKKRGLKKPLFIAPENIFPETYGSHPQELRNLILKSREAMANKLIKQGYSKQEAKKLASDHIKATFDIGHAYIWKKYFQGSEKEFNEWLKKQVSQLAKEGIIGHVHLSDNFGYYDEHLAPGEGSVPIKEFAKEIEKQGYKGPMIVEAGAQPEGEEYEVLTGAFRTLQSPIYRIDTLSQTWSDIQTSYFSRTSGTPGYLVGDYAPSKDWTLWTEVPLE